MVRTQTFVVTIEQPYKDGCGEVVPALNEGDIRSALWKGLSVESRSISVEECGDMGTVRFRRKDDHIHVRGFIDKDNRQERTMKRMKAVCLKEIDSDGNVIWEMVNTGKGECVDYFGSPDEAREYASSHGIEITEFVVGDWNEK